jgi:hypothetical protein
MRWPGALSERPRSTIRDDAVTVVLSAWVVLGFLLDGWVHRTSARLDTFFTPYHAVIYSGYIALSFWVLWLAGRTQRPGQRLADCLPAAYELAGVGVACFVLGSIGDLIWHAIFGIERSISALLSPTHLLLFSGLTLIATSPYRAAVRRARTDAPSLQAFLIPLASVTLATAMTAFVLQYISLFVLDIGPGREASAVGSVAAPGREGQVGLAVATLLVTVLVLVTTFVFLLRRWRLPVGSVTCLFGGVGVLLGITSAFHEWNVILAAAVSGVAADVIVARLRPSPARRPRFVATAMIVPGVLAASMVAAIALRRGLGWQPELIGGVILLSAFAGFALSLLSLPPVTPGVDPVLEGNGHREREPVGAP